MSLRNALCKSNPCHATVLIIIGFVLGIKSEVGSSGTRKEAKEKKIKIKKLHLSARKLQTEIVMDRLH